MDYVLIIIFQVLGFGFKCGQQITLLRKKYPQKSPKEVNNAFWFEDWNTFIMSGVVLGTDLATHYVISKLGIDWSQTFTLLGVLLTWEAVYLVFSVGIAIVLGYKGQDLIYKWLGSAADRLDKEVSSKIE